MAINPNTEPCGRFIRKDRPGATPGSPLREEQYIGDHLAVLAQHLIRVHMRRNAEPTLAGAKHVCLAVPTVDPRPTAFKDDGFESTRQGWSALCTTDPLRFKVLEVILVPVVRNLNPLAHSKVIYRATPTVRLIGALRGERPSPKCAW